MRDLKFELEWLKRFPHFEERPANITEFLGEDYLGIAGRVRPSLISALEDIFGPETDGVRIAKYSKAMFTGAIGIGKTTMASIVLPYLAHWVLCLKDPQGFFRLLPGSRIAFMQMSTSGTQAKEVVFGDIKARIEYSKWFSERYPFDRNFKNQIRFPKEIWILPGDSSETTFEGYNILGGILDEADSHKTTEVKDYAEQGYDTIHSRIASRFEDRGFLFVIGQMKKATGFAARKFEEMKKDPQAYAIRMTIWESLGWDHYLKPDGTRNSFWYDAKRHEIVPKVAGLLGTDHLIEIPKVFLADFQNNPEKALRDLAGIPPAVGAPFISLTYKIESAQERWIENHGGHDTPVDDSGRVAKWFYSNGPLKRVIHLDMAYSADGDSLGLAMGHVSHVIEIDGERKPYIVIDLLMRIHAPSGREIFLGDVRRIVYDLRDERRFKVVKATMDGFQCLTGDTRIPLLNGADPTIAELAASHPDGGFWTYSFDGKRIVPGRGLRAWQTGERHVIEVQIDNGESVRCTPDHPFMLRDGTYREARDLQPGDSLMPLYRRVTPDDWRGLRGYEQVLQPGPLSTDSRFGRTQDGYTRGRWQFTHRMAMQSSPSAGYVDHHVDFNKRNNDPTNLKRLLLEDHLALHRRHGETNFRAMWDRPGHREKMSRIISESNSERTGRRSRRYRHDVSLVSLEDYKDLSRQRVTELTGWSQDLIYARVREAGYSGWEEFRKSPTNHKVVAVVDRGEVEPVYDLTIEDHHNFAIGAGVFVHNSTDTRQQFEKRRIPSEIVSVDKQMLPYEDLREALYEDRIEFPKYMVRVRPNDTSLTNIAYKELSELIEADLKIDHPPGGSKDVADCLAGVTYTLMGDRLYHRKVTRLDLAREQKSAAKVAGGDPYGGYSPGTAALDTHAPLPPTDSLGLWRPNGR